MIRERTVPIFSARSCLRKGVPLLKRRMDSTLYSMGGVSRQIIMVISVKGECVYDALKREKILLIIKPISVIRASEMP